MSEQQNTKRLKHNNLTPLADVLDRLHSLLTNGGAEGEDGDLEELSPLQPSLNSPGDTAAAAKAIAGAHQQLQAAIVALQAAIDRFTPPPGYKPPAPGDEAFVRGLLSYAHRLSYSSSAPLGYQTGQPLYFFKPPAPQEAEMRASKLHTFSRDWEARQQAAAAQRKELPAALEAATFGAQEPPESAPALAQDMAAMAAQHGLDVGQLLASMPVGWKPGDPIPVGPAAAAGEASAAADRPKTTPPAAAPLAVPREEGRAPAAPPPLTGIFLDDFGQYDYDVSSGEDGGDSDESSDDD